MSFRTYHDVMGEDRSRLGEQVAAQRARVRERLRAVKRLVAVMSGKGGVGKSHVTAALALAAAERLPGRVAVLDADLHGPTVARLLDARGPLRLDAEGVAPAIGRGGVAVFSTDLLLDEGRPLAWRGSGGERFVWRSAIEAGTLREFLSDVAWGALDLLLVDLPPGTDRLHDLAELAPALTSAVAVTIPSEESRHAVERAMRAALDAGVPVVGVIENMSGYACGACGAVRPLFEGSAGADLAAEFGVPQLGRVPFRAAGPAEGPRLPSDVVEAVLASTERTPHPAPHTPQ